MKCNGTKEPKFLGWRQYAERLPTLEELHVWHSQRRYGIGATGGPASGNLAVLDFETWPVFKRWGEPLSGDDREQLQRCPVVGTPKGGAHVYARTAEPVKGCKLARTKEGETLIEVRGCQHYVVAPGSPAACHPLNRVYRILRPGWLDGGQWEPMALDVWHGLTVLAADLNEYSRPAAREVVGDRHEQVATGDRPGDHFNVRVGWSDILTPHGWSAFRASGGTTYWSRPGKKPAGVSASTGFCKGSNGNDLMYLFSTSAVPFEAETSYSKFAVYALLNHHGDFRAATRALGQAGYGKLLPKIRVTWKGGVR